MKARWSMRCGCGCGYPIQVGAQFVRYASQPWKPEHLIKYKADRRVRRQQMTLPQGRK